MFKYFWPNKIKQEKKQEKEIVKQIDKVRNTRDLTINLYSRHFEYYIISQL